MKLLFNSKIMREFPEIHRLPIYCLESDGENYLAGKVARIPTYFRFPDVAAELSEEEMSRAAAEFEVIPVSEPISLYYKAVAA